MNDSFEDAWERFAAGDGEKTFLEAFTAGWRARGRVRSDHALVCAICGFERELNAAIMPFTWLCPGCRKKYEDRAAEIMKEIRK